MMHRSVFFHHAKSKAPYLNLWDAPAGYYPVPKDDVHSNDSASTLFGNICRQCVTGALTVMGIFILAERIKEGTK